MHSLSSVHKEQIRCVGTNLRTDASFRQRMDKPDMTTSIVATRDLTCRFGQHLAVDQLNLSIEPGEIFGLLGPNGAGKTTTLKMLVTLLPPSSGTAEIAGFDIVRSARNVRRSIGYVPQLLSADSALSGYENLKLSAWLYGLRGVEASKRIESVLQLMGLEDAAHRLVKTYSGGMIRRLELAQAMIHHPPVLILDEPTIGLDPVARHTVWQHLIELRTTLGTTVLLTTHDMEEADYLCNRIAIMHRGRIAAIGTPIALKEQVGTDANLDQVFAHFSGTELETGERFHDIEKTRSTVSRLS